MSDWIGFPTLYYLPLPQSINEIQFIGGGSSLLYGPEPAPAVNFVTKHPEPGSPWNFYTEQIGGAYGYYSTYNGIQEAMGPLEFRFDGGYVRSDGNVITARTICGKSISTWATGTSTSCLRLIFIPAGLTAAIRDGSRTNSFWMTKTFRPLRTIMTGLIGTRLFSVMNVTLETAGSCKRKDGSLIRRSTSGPAQTLTRQRRIHFHQVLFSVTRNSIMVEPTYASASYGGMALSLKAALSRLAALFIMAMRRFSDTR